MQLKFKVQLGYNPDNYVNFKIIDDSKAWMEQKFAQYTTGNKHRAWLISFLYKLQILNLFLWHSEYNSHYVNI